MICGSHANGSSVMTMSMPTKPTLCASFWRKMTRYPSLNGFHFLQIFFSVPPNENINLKGKRFVDIIDVKLWNIESAEVVNRRRISKTLPTMKKKKLDTNV